MNNGYGSGKDTRQTALRDLYVKLGGNIADVAEENDINRLIRDLGDVAGGGGGGGGVLVVHVIRTATGESETYTLDKTWQELADALNSGKSLSFFEWDSNENIGKSYSWNISYLIVGIYDGGGEVPLETDSPDGYPTATV